MSLFKTIIQAENEVWLKDSVQKNFYLYFEIEAKKVQPSAERIPLNVSLVVDRSGSMSGDKLSYVKKAVDFVIDNLASEDILSIVQYDDEIDVVVPSKEVTGKKELHKKVSQIEARGMTNLSGGMLEGYTQVDSTKKDKYVNRVLLLSDGLANRGVTDHAKLQQIAQNKFREQGIGLSTFGVGADFNEVLMTHLSEYGGANYYFIDTPEKIPQIFAEELEGLLSVVAQNTKLTIEYKGEYFNCSQVFGYPFEIDKNKVAINFNDVVSEEKKAVLIKFDVVKQIDKEIDFNLNLSFEDVVEKMDKVSLDSIISLGLTSDKSEFERKVQPKVIEQIVYFTANKLYEDAITLGDKRDLKGAAQLIKQAKEYIEAHFKSYSQTEELKKLYDYILDYENRLKQMETMSSHDYIMSQKQSRSYQYMSKRKK